MRLPASAHTGRPWRVHAIAGDFALADVWRLPTPGGPDDLIHLVRQFSGTAPRTGGAAPEQSSSPFAHPVAATLLGLRWKLGALLGWDGPGTGIGARVPSLRERLPDDLRDGPRGPDARPIPFRSVYTTRDEWLAEIANRTVHAALHLGWVPDGSGGYHAQMAVLVKPNGRFGRAYLAGIKPFRRFGVYPAMFEAAGRRWQETAALRATD
ncbi:DUF2867 domain-containing protein [Streptomyces sp. NPDC020875]|uniref:DUF2867 domain-containing protein n=1 Tax=Streptomyces sp. NPDC020875 TaxID=3154898 RepID=UPI0033EE767B